MYCPTCSLEHTEPRRFCNRCGTNLELVLRALSGNWPEPMLNKKPEQREKALYFTERGRMQRWGFITFWGGIVLAALVAIIGEAIRNLNDPFGNFIQEIAGIGGLICVVGLGMMLYSLFLPKAPTPAQPPSVTVLPQANSTMPVSLEQRPDAVSSITEYTTELLSNGEPSLPRQMPTHQRK